MFFLRTCSIVCFLSISICASAQSLSRRAFVKQAVCSALFLPQIQSSQKLGLENFTRATVEQSISRGFIQANRSNALYETLRWQVWDNLQAQLKEVKANQWIRLQTPITIMFPSGHELHVLPIFEVHIAGHVRDPQRGPERLIHKIRLLSSHSSRRAAPESVMVRL